MDYFEIVSFIIMIGFVIVFVGAFVSIVATIVRQKNAYNKVSNTVKDYIKTSVNTANKKGNTHESQMRYSEYYSEKPIKDSGVHDKELSEAERNVLYGK